MISVLGIPSGKQMVFLILGYFEESLITHKVLKNQSDRNSVVSAGLGNNEAPLPPLDLKG